MSDSTLLATKLYLPAPHLALVVRPRLVALLQAGVRGKLVLVSAPAGFGKTTLAADWLGQSGAPTGVGWLSLDESDNTPVVFWLYVLAALRRAAATAAAGEAARAALLAPQPPPIESVLVALINDLSGLPAPLLLVLDDFHTISTPEILRGLDFLLEHLPPNLHLLLLTREDPPLALSRLRARGQLSEIRAADLRFTPQETDEFLNRLMALELAPVDVAALAQRTEGWVTGLRLAALSLQASSDRHGFIDAFTASHRFLTDYLIDEVFSRQEEDLCDFMLRTSILRRFCPALCDAVLGGSSGQAFLRRLEQSNLFLVPLDDERRWYRYHHLFAQFLHMRLREAEPERVALLYQRAMDWCAGQGLLREALEYALEAGDNQRAAEWIEQIAPEVLNNEGPFGVLNWLAALPADLLRQRPWLSLHQAQALAAAGKTEESLAWLETAERAASSPDDNLRAYAAGQRAYLLFFQGSFAAAQTLARQALAGIPVGDDAARVRAGIILGSACRLLGDLDASRAVFGEVAAAAQKTGHLFTSNMVYSSLGALYNEQGLLHQANATYQQALDSALRLAGRPDLPFTGFAYFAIGRIQREWNDLLAAEEYMQRGEALSREWYQKEFLAIGLMELALLRWDQQDALAAHLALDEARRISVEIGSPWGTASVDNYRARLHLAAGDLPAAQRWAHAAGLNANDAPGYDRLVDYLTFARVLLAQGQAHAADSLLQRLIERCQAIGATAGRLEALIWQACARQADGRPEPALAALREALALGEPQGYLRSFLDAGATIADLLRRLPTDPYPTRLLAAFAAEQFPGHSAAQTSDDRARPLGRGIEALPPDGGIEALPSDGGIEAQPLGRGIEAINEREVAVLRLIAAGLSNREIGAELFLSENTIRWYASQIYLKLAAAGRKDAAAKAKKFGLI